MAFGKKIKGLFFEVDEESEEAQEKNDVPKKKGSEKVEVPISSSKPSPPIEVPKVSTPVTQINPEVFKSIEDALSEANLEGFDYFEFAKILEGLKEKIPSEEARYQTAYTTSAIMGTTKATLLETAQHYLSVLNRESDKFSAFYKDQIKNTVTDKEASLISIDKAIEEKQQQIKLLNDEINEITKSKTVINNEIIENQSKADKIKNDFMATIGIFLKRVNDDAEKIQKYITE